MNEFFKMSSFLDRGYLEDILCRVPSFIAKLWILVEDPDTDEVISWNDHGTTFTVHDHVTLSKVHLPKHFKHGNYTSFVRQLNMYDFHKQVSLTSGLTEEKATFYHSCFLKDGPALLVEIRRKIARKNGTFGDDPALDRAISTTHQFNSRHCNLIVKFRELKQSRKAIRRGLAELRLRLADGDTQANASVGPATVVASDEEIENASDERIRDVTETQQGNVTDVAEAVAKGTETLREVTQQMSRQHRLYMQELQVALQSRQRLASLEEEGWKMRMQAAEQELANRELERLVLSKELEYHRARSGAAAAGSAVEEPAVLLPAGDE